MKIKALLIISILFLITSLSYAYDNVLILDRTPFAYERVTVTTVAVSRLNAIYREQSGAVFITVETNNIRYRIDNNNPSITNGHLVVASAYQNIWLTDQSAIKQFRMIGIGGSAIVHITYYRKN